MSQRIDYNTHIKKEARAYVKRIKCTPSQSLQLKKVSKATSHQTDNPLTMHTHEFLRKMRKYFFPFLY